MFRHHLTSIFPAFLFLISGFLSSFFYYRYPEDGGGLLPGLFYTSGTFIVFLNHKIKLNLKDSVVYYSCMYMTCLMAIGITFYSGYFGLIVGIVMGGLGALSTFVLTDILIARINYSKTRTFFLGSISFVIVLLINLTFREFFTRSPIPLFFDMPYSFSSIMGEVFIFWQLIIGVHLNIVVKSTASGEASNDTRVQL